MCNRLIKRAAGLPTKPGVYLFKNAKGRVLYVGKAANLRARVRQYVAYQDARTMVPFLVDAAHIIDVVITDTEKEALLLENTLIKKHRPRYNVKLRDDSNFLHLRIDLREKWPHYQMLRHFRDDGAQYFGPYHSASKARSTLEVLQRAFPLRTCTDQVLKSRRRPCLLFQMGRCVAPCVDEVSKEKYQELAVASTHLLSGKKSIALQHLEQRMQDAAEDLNFEKAARLRDLLFGIRASVERQKVVDPKMGNRDIWGMHREGSRGILAILPVREGAMGEPRTNPLQSLVGSDAEVLSSLINAAYPKGTVIPREIVLPALPPDAALLEEILTDRRGKKVQLHAPQRGDKIGLVHLATKNARIRWMSDTDAEERHRNAMQALADALQLPDIPRRIECFDNSNWGGTNPVAAMSVFIDGKPDRREYRRYKIKTVVGSDDYASMREIVERRFRRAIKENNAPDLLVVDGGKGQLGVAMAVLEDLGLHDQAVVGIVKPRTEHKKGNRAATDRIVLPHLKDPLKLAPNHPALLIMQYLRDEVHKHAIRYHRKVRSKNQLISVLEGIDGVGPTRRKALLRTLGSAEGVASALPQEIARVPGIGPTLAQHIFETLNPQD
ncbi:MAG: excinuclease ABC subunit UvrC [Rhodobacterales bacterium]|nr:excinuclease ABC subunit UvrC [Rhodobacterales bacterium]